MLVRLAPFGSGDGQLQVVTVTDLEALVREFVPGLSLSTPGVAVGLVERGELVAATALGHAIPGQPIDARNAVFNLASTSKQFTAFAALLLAEDGRLDLDRSLRSYLGALPPIYAPVTARMLLQHTSGVHDYLVLWRLLGRSFTDHVGARETFDLLARQQSLSFTPGSQHSYNNSGYFLLSWLVEQISGQSLAQFSAHRIFRPLGMHGTCIIDRYPARIDHLAPAWKSDDGGNWLPDLPVWEPTGDGQVHSTLADLAIWDRNFYGAPLVGKAQTIEAMRSPALLPDGTALPYGCGLELGKLGSFRTERHGGTWAGYRSEMLRLPEAGVTVIVLANRGDIDAPGLADKVARKWLDLPDAPQRPQARTGLAAGLYRNRDWNDHTRVVLTEDGIAFDDDGQMIPIAEDMTCEDGRIEPDGQGFRIHGPDGTTVFDPVSDWSDADITALVGTYAEPVNAVRYTLRDDRGLVAEGPFGPLRLVARSVDHLDSDGRPSFRVIREKGEVVGLDVNLGQRLRNLRLIRQ